MEFSLSQRIKRCSTKVSLYDAVIKKLSFRTIEFLSIYVPINFFSTYNHPLCTSQVRVDNVLCELHKGTGLTP
jgi:hypothetical protein